MARKPSREELLAKIASLETRATVAAWMLRQARAFPPDTHIVVTSPRGVSTFLVSTDEHGAPACIWSEIADVEAHFLLESCRDDEARYTAAAKGIDALRKAGGYRRTDSEPKKCPG